MAQADYLNRVQHDARNKYQLKHEEQVTKENFRKRLENFFQDVLSKQHPDLDPHGVRLKCYGSLNNGFGLAGCDMDLLLALPETLLPKTLAESPQADSQPGPAVDARKPAEHVDGASTTEDNVEASPQENFAVGWLLEGALLDAGLGARLLTKTRVPILKVCERPSGELLHNLRQYRLDQMKPEAPAEPDNPNSNFDLPPSLNMNALELALQNLEDQDSAAEVAVPGTRPQQPAASLEFEGDYGIKCDVNFSNSVAVHNTRLLREYCLYDPRVAQVGVFVKTWAKTRNINTPYWGTLSSYGYVLMVLHYLMNVVHPPVIPNLQHLAHNEDAWNPGAAVQLFEGKFDIRFLTDKTKIDAYRKTMAQNRDSTGNLIRGFFWYYSAREGFNWKNDIISIRTQGGVVRKFAKGWTEAKWSEHASKNKVRQRYLMAIEDPFETDHNVARVVGHNGIVAIRDEFRRAWDIIGQVGSGAPMEDLMQSMEGRGDLLRKDQDHHREKMRKMREALEAKERTLREAAVVENGQAQENGTSSDNESPSFPLRPVSAIRQAPDSKLTRVSMQRDKPRQYGRRVRKVNDGSESDDEDNHKVNVKASDSTSDDVQAVKSNDAAGLDLGIQDPEPFCSADEISFSMGFDLWGNAVAWDLSTQDGRWLQWRDNRARAGTWRGAKRPDLAALDDACPFDARRPKGEQPAVDVFPPYPLNKDEGRTSVTQSFHVRKSHGESKQRDKKRKPRRRKAVAPALPDERDAVDKSASIKTEDPVEGPSSQISPEPLAAGHPESADPDSPNSIVTNPWSIEPPATQQTLPDVDDADADPPDAPPTNVKVITPDAIEPVRGVRSDRIIRAPIKYNRWTAGGCWLQARDAKVRSGRFNVAELDEWELALHLNFPYTPEMLVSKLVDCNHQLRDHWKSRPLGDITRALRNRILEVTKPDNEPLQFQKDVWPVVTALKDLTPTPEDASPSLPNTTTCTHTLTSLSQLARPESTPLATVKSVEKDTEDDMPNSAFIRSRRLAFFAQRQQSETSRAVDGSLTDERTVMTLMREAGIEVMPPLTKKDSAIGIWATSDSENNGHTKIVDGQGLQHSTAATETEQGPGPGPTQEECAGAINEIDPAETAEDEIHDASKTQLTPSVKVPSTRYPNTPVEERPRDEDPRIMPIPRKYGFKFDVRQLRDLAVIKEGGNGCARDGQEFEIEENYEWGGGGEMGYKSTSGVQQSSASNGEVYEYGKGDEGGLLNELPGIDD